MRNQWPVCQLDVKFTSQNYRIKLSTWSSVSVPQKLVHGISGPGGGGGGGEGLGEGLGPPQPAMMGSWPRPLTSLKTCRYVRQIEEHGAMLYNLHCSAPRHSPEF